MDKKIFNYEEMPIAYLSVNPNSDKLRKQLINNLVNINSSSIDNLETIFFSKNNINLINKKLIISIYKITNKEFKIVEQSDETLLIVMRYVYINNASHLPCNIEQQIEELNTIVLNEIIPNIITSITQKVNYLKYINERPPLLKLPESTYNSKLLQSYI
jgi:hypothetical protein